MIKKEYRSLKHFVMMSLKLNEISISENLSFLFAYPNDNSYPIFKKMLEYKDIARQHFYVLPTKIANLKKLPKFLNIFNGFFCSIISSNLLLTFSKNYINKKDIKKVNDTIFNNQRYNDKHTHKKNEEFEYFYKIENFEGNDVAYLIDVQPLTKKNIEIATKEIYVNHKNDIDIIIYIGYLNFRPLNLIKVPLKYEPKNINFIAVILDNNTIDDRLFHIENWESNLSNFDVI